MVALFLVFLFSRRMFSGIPFSKIPFIFWWKVEKCLNLKCSFFDSPLKTFIRCQCFPCFPQCKKPCFPLILIGFRWDLKKDNLLNLSTFRWGAIEKDYISKSDYFHGFAFSDCGENISSLRKNTFAKYFRGILFWKLFCTGNIFRETVSHFLSLVRFYFPTFSLHSRIINRLCFP